VHLVFGPQPRYTEMFIFCPARIGRRLREPRLLRASNGRWRGSALVIHSKMSPIAALFRRLRRASQNGTRFVDARELPSLMLKHIYTGAMGSIYFSLLTGIWLVTFGSAIGLQYWHWAIISAASSFVLILQLFSAFLATRVGGRKFLWFSFAMSSRLLRAAAIAVAFWFYASRPSLGRGLFVLLMIVANTFDAFCAPLWWSWFADIIPRNTHGHFSGRRTSWIALANLVVVVPIGIVLDHTREGYKLPMLVVAFAFAFLIGALDLLIHRTIPEPPMVVPSGNFWRQVAVPLRDKAFRPWLIFWAAWSFSMTFGGSLSLVYFAENLHFKQNFTGGGIVLIILPLIGSMIAARRLGAMVDTHGVGTMLRWGHAFWASLPGFWLVATPRTAPLLLGVSSLISGTASNTAVNAANKLITRLPEPAHVPMYVAVSTCVGALAGGFGPVFGGLVLNATEGVSWHVGTVALLGWHILFFASLVMRYSCLSLIRRIGEPAPAPAMEIPRAA